MTCLNCGMVYQHCECGLDGKQFKETEMENEPKEIYLNCYNLGDNPDEPETDNFSHLDHEFVLWSENKPVLEVSIKYIHHSRLSALEAENHKLRESLGINEPWPVSDVLITLSQSTETLLNVYNYDRHGWEDISHCTKVARKMADNILRALKQNP